MSAATLDGDRDVDGVDDLLTVCRAWRRVALVEIAGAAWTAAAAGECESWRETRRAVLVNVILVVCVWVRLDVEQF